MVDREIYAARTAAFVMILLHRHADRQIVDDRNHLAQVLREQPVEQHLVAVVQGGQIDVLAQRVRQPLVLDVGALDLRLQRADVGREQAGEAQGFSFLRREGGALVQQRRIEHRQPAGLGLVATVPVRPALGHGRQYRDHSLSHCCYLFCSLRAGAARSRTYSSRVLHAGISGSVSIEALAALSASEIDRRASHDQMRSNWFRPPARIHADPGYDVLWWLQASTRRPTSRTLEATQPVWGDPAFPRRRGGVRRSGGEASLEESLAAFTASVHRERKSPISDSTQIVPHPVNDLPADRQTETAAVDIAICQTWERHEYTRLVLLRDADAVILDSNDPVRSTLPGSHVNFRLIDRAGSFDSIRSLTLRCSAPVRFVLSRMERLATCLLLRQEGNDMRRFLILTAIL